MWLMGNNQMNRLAEMVYIGEIVLQSKIAALAAQRLVDREERLDWIETWSSIQSILVAAANVSKILWPQGLFRKLCKRSFS